MEADDMDQLQGSDSAPTGFETFTPVTSPRYEQNAERCSGDDWPCFVCGKPCSKTSAHWFNTTEGRHLCNMDDPRGASNTGCYPVGPECIKKLPARVRRWSGPQPYKGDV